jgi:hypothetical protein
MGLSRRRIVERRSGMNSLLLSPGAPRSLIGGPRIDRIEQKEE